MRLRTALKICKTLHGHPKRKHGKWLWKPRIGWNREQCMVATEIGQRKDDDRRFWFVPTEDGQIERAEMVGCILIDAFCDDPDEADDRKEALIADLERGRP